MIALKKNPPMTNGFLKAAPPADEESNYFHQWVLNWSMKTREIKLFILDGTSFLWMDKLENP